MKRGFIIYLICFSLFFINASITVQAEGEGVPADAVACVIPEGAAEVKYFNTLTNALTDAQSNKNCTLKLLKDVSSATQIAITSGDFTFDLNGKRLSTEVANGECISVQDASVCFEDSSSEGTGTVKGPSSAISIWGDAKVTIVSGTYEAGTWGIVTTDTPDKQVTLKINGGCFRGNVGVQTSMGTHYKISGGEFYGAQNSVNNNGTMEITGGTFYGEVYNAGGATLYFEKGTVVVSEKSSHAYAGIENKGTLNLYGGNISAAEDAEKPMKGVSNGNDAILNLYGDVTFQNVVTDFQLEEAMNICGTLKNTYRVTMSIPEDDEGIVFAKKVKPEISLSDVTFISGETGSKVSVSDDGTFLSLSKCEHKELNHVYACKTCGLQMYACIGDTYYTSLAGALKAVENAESEKKTVKVLRDISEDVMADVNISGGTFTLDFNGHTIEDTLNVNKGKVTIVGNGGTLAGLNIQENAFVEMSGLTVKGDNPIINSGAFHMIDGKVDGGQMAIVNMLGTAYLEGGEILAEGIAVINYGGTVTIGTEDGEGPVIEASVGILNSKYQVENQGIIKDADLIIKGGRIKATTDIYNKTGTYALDPNGKEQFPGVAGTVTLMGGTFEDGISAVLDEGTNLEDILGEDYWYYDNNDQKVSLEEGKVSLDETVIVKKLTEEIIEEDSDYLEEGSDYLEEDSDYLEEDSDYLEEDSDYLEEDSDYLEEDPELKDDKNSDSGAVETGDSNSIVVWLAALLISGLILSKKKYLR